MAPPAVHTINCYIYRDPDTHLWTGLTGDLPDCRVTCIQPEDTLRRIHSVVLEKLSTEVMTTPLANNLQVNINVLVVSEEEAKRLANQRPLFDLDDADP